MHSSTDESDPKVKNKYAKRDLGHGYYRIALKRKPKEPDFSAEDHGHHGCTHDVVFMIRVADKNPHQTDGPSQEVYVFLDEWIFFCDFYDWKQTIRMLRALT